MTTYYYQADVTVEGKGRELISENIEKGCVQIGKSVEAASWIEAKALFGFPLSSAQNFILKCREIDYDIIAQGALNESALAFGVAGNDVTADNVVEEVI